MRVKVVSGIFGFEKITEFTLERIDDFFSVLSAGDISFTLIDPLKLRDYQFEIPAFYKKLLKYDKKENIKVYCIVVLQNPIEESMINFLAPVVVNEDKNLLVQIALDEHKYSDYDIADKIKRYL